MCYGCYPVPLFVRCSWRCRRRLSVVYWGCLFYNGGMSLNLAPTFANVSALFGICGILPHGVPSLTPRLTALCPRFVGRACVRLFGRITACSPPVIGVLPQRLSNRYLSVIYYPFGVLCPPVIFRRFTVGLPTVPRVLSPVACPLLFRCCSVAIVVGWLPVRPQVNRHQQGGTFAPFYDVAGVVCRPLFYCVAGGAFVRLRNGA